MTNNRFIGTVLLVAIVALTFGAVFSLADPSGASDVTRQGSSFYGVPTSAQTAPAQGGNVSEIDIDAIVVTTAWAGFYGDITGEIVLGNSGNDKFYNWTLTSVDGLVYGTRAASITWDNVVCADGTAISTENTYLGVSSTDADSVENTFTQRDHPALVITDSNTVSTDTCNSTFAFSSGIAQTSDWVQVLLHDGGSNIVYSTATNDSTTGFDGSAYDFQLLVGENEKTGSIGATDYYFWVQLQ